jgi:hypothetical protein
MSHHHTDPVNRTALAKQSKHDKVGAEIASSSNGPVSLPKEVTSKSFKNASKYLVEAGMDTSITYLNDAHAPE